MKPGAGGGGNSIVALGFYICRSRVNINLQGGVTMVMKVKKKGTRFLSLLLNYAALV